LKIVNLCLNFIPFPIIVRLTDISVKTIGATINKFNFKDFLTRM